MRNKKNKSIRVVNPSKRSTFVVHLVNNIEFPINNNLKRFKIIINSYKSSDFIKLEAFCILIRKPKL